MGFVMHELLKPTWCSSC